MKYKKLTKEQIIISLDRLTRFKNPRTKYFRFFSDIILSNLIEPKYKKSDLEKLDAAKLRDIAIEIFNSSLDVRTKNYNINTIISDYEKTVFNIDDDTRIFLDNKIDYIAALPLIPEDCVINLKWLKSLQSAPNQLENRQKLKLKFPICKVILVEGLTEEILLPEFAKFLGHDFYKEGIEIIPAGGKNQVVKLYYKLQEELKLPIFLLLDEDAEENIAQIKLKLRPIDKIHKIKCGEFEDLLSKSLIIKTVNSHLSNFAAITENELPDEISEVENLENIFKTKGLHEFKKAEFAKMVKENITERTDISAEIADIIREISSQKPINFG